jgi:methionyl-tRNA formyltransferase
MRIVLFGYSSLGARVLEALLGSQQELLGVCTHTRTPGEATWFRSMATMASHAGVPVWTVPAGRWNATPGSAQAQVEKNVAALKPDLILSAYFRSLLPSTMLGDSTRAALNLHGSLLPRYRGRAPVNWVLLHGEKETGVTLHHMTDVADAGDVVACRRLAIGDDETAPELQRRLDDAAAELTLEMLPRIEAGTAPRLPQNDSESTAFGRRHPADGRLQWSWPASRIHNLVRAVTRPFPGAFVEEDLRRLYLWKTRMVLDSSPSLRPGEFFNATRGQRQTAWPPEQDTDVWLVGTGDGLLQILEWSRETVKSS